MNEWQSESGTDGEDEPERSRQRPRKSAREKVMDFLARRDHSELELRRKLAPWYEAREIDEAIQFAKESKWMKPPEELAETVASQLGRRGKGTRYIQRFLRNKGLPSVRKDAGIELAKALDLIQIKLRREPPFEYDEHAKIARLLKNRGYDDETIRSALHAREKTET
ncbi:MAG: recombination regulator RecX [Bdellovibrionaceae bacterium]|nr:recombination regulator RecX [Pseudobdellovibrionaceae bacterium]